MSLAGISMLNFPPSASVIVMSGPSLVTVMTGEKGELTRPTQSLTTLPVRGTGTGGLSLLSTVLSMVNRAPANTSGRAAKRAESLEQDISYYSGSASSAICLMGTPFLLTMMALSSSLSARVSGGTRAVAVSLPRKTLLRTVSLTV
jgi:hypothetical protein